MKKIFQISMLVLVMGVFSAQAEETNAGVLKNKTSNPQNTTNTPNLRNSQETLSSPNSSIRLMKIESDESVESVRKKAFIEELRKLYKANFL